MITVSWDGKFKAFRVCRDAPFHKKPLVTLSASAFYENILTNTGAYAK